jgi:hypothetical protein
MKRVMLALLCLAFVLSVASAQTTEPWVLLKDNHKKAMQNFGHFYMWDDAKCFNTIVGGSMVSVVKGTDSLSFYTEDNGRKLYTLLTLSRGEKATEMCFTFENKLTVKNSTYDVKYIYTFDFGSTPGYRVKTSTSLRWDLEKCWDCIKCAGDNIGALYKAYQECQLDCVEKVRGFYHASYRKGIRLRFRN